MLKKISSNSDKLNELSKQYNWIPNSNSIRPENEENKNIYFGFLICNYGSIYKGTLKDIFKIDNLDEIKPTKLFAENKFKYNITGNHYVMWYLLYEENEITDEIINCDIFCNIYQKIGNNNFNFAWYKNPKPSVPEIFHLQVFWINKN